MRSLRVVVTKPGACQFETILGSNPKRALLFSAAALLTLPAVMPAQAETIEGGSDVTIDGGGGGSPSSPWELAEDLFINDGTLTILNGGAVSDQKGTVGDSPGSTGTVTVTGAESKWTNSEDLYVGGGGTGTLTIEDGGAVSNTQGYVSFNPGSTGTVTVTGAESKWTNSEDLYVGAFGVGTLTISDGGEVSNTRGYVGDSLSSTVTVTGAGSKWTNSGNLSVGNLGTGTLSIAGGGVVSVDGGGGTVFVAESSSSTGTLNIGAGAGDAAVAAGTLDADQVAFGDGTGKLVFNHTDDDYMFGAIISGDGAVEVYSGATILDAANTYTGKTDIHGGILRVNGSITSATTIMDGGVLGGSGTVGIVEVRSGGSLAPGNSIGTLNTDDTTFKTGSSYDVEIDNTGASDLLNATGTVTIESDVALNVTSFPAGDDGSTYDLSTDYTLITATGGVTGTFDTVTESFLFLDASASYDANNVYLQMVRNDVDYVSVAQTPNQFQTADGVESIGIGNPVYNSIFPLGAREARDAFDALSGEIHPAVTGQLLESSRTRRSAALNRIRDAFRISETSSSSVMLAYNGDPIDNTAFEDDDLTAKVPAVWAQLTGSWDTRDATTDHHAIDATTDELLFGVDGENDAGWRFGALAGYGRGEVKADALGSEADTESFTVGVYGGTRMGAMGISFGGDYTWHNITSERSVAYVGFTEQLSASYNANTAQIFGELDYRFESGSGAFEPFANVAHVRHETDGFTETGGTAALTAPDASSHATFTTLGLRADAMVGAGFKLYGSAAWRRNLDDTMPDADFSFAGGSIFNITGQPIVRDAALVEVGISRDLTKDISVDLSYDSLLSSDAANHAIHASSVMKF